MTETPDFVRSHVSALLDSMGLRFAALDFSVDPEGQWWFECNPNGQWAWIEEETGLPISGALADALEGTLPALTEIKELQAEFMAVLTGSGVIKDQKWLSAFHEIPRGLFVPCYFTQTTDLSG